MRTENLARIAAEAARYRLGVRPGWVDVFKAIRSRDEFHLLRYPLPTNALEGAFVRRESGSYILVNSAFPISRQRFTAAHELGHASLEPDVDVLTHIEQDLHLADDRPANRFAAYFLMDVESVEAIAGQYGDPAVLSMRIANEFEVSLDAAAIHLKELGLITEAQRHEVVDAREHFGSLARFAKALGMPAPRSRRADDAIDPGPEYLADLAALARVGLVVPEQAEAMRRLGAASAT